MPRPKRCRFVGFSPGSTLFKPAGIPARDCEQVVLAVDGFEALRLADFEGLYHEEAATRMGVSRQTFGRILESARKTVAQALVMGLVLKIEGGHVQMANKREFRCADCGHTWEVPFGGGRPVACPACQSGNLHRDTTEQPEAVINAGHCHRKRRGGGIGRCQARLRGKESQIQETDA